MAEATQPIGIENIALEYAAAKRVDDKRVKPIKPQELQSPTAGLEARSQEEPQNTVEGRLVGDAKAKVDGEKRMQAEIDENTNQRRILLGKYNGFVNAQTNLLNGVPMPEEYQGIDGKQLESLIHGADEATQKIDSLSQKMRDARGEKRPNDLFEEYEGVALEAVFDARAREIAASQEIRAILTRGENINWDDPEEAKRQLEEIKIEPLDVDERRAAKGLRNAMLTARADKYRALFDLLARQERRNPGSTREEKAKLLEEQNKALENVGIQTDLPDEDEKTKVRNDGASGVEEFISRKRPLSVASRGAFRSAIGIQNWEDAVALGTIIPEGPYDNLLQTESYLHAVNARYIEALVKANGNPRLTEEALGLDLLRGVAIDFHEAANEVIAREYKVANGFAFQAAQGKIDEAQGELDEANRPVADAKRHQGLVKAAARVPQILTLPLGAVGLAIASPWLLTSEIKRKVDAGAAASVARAEEDTLAQRDIAAEKLKNATLNMDQLAKGGDIPEVQNTDVGVNRV